MKYLYTLLITIIIFGVSNAQSIYSLPVTWGAFEGATFTPETNQYTFTGQDWAGFANTNNAIYPLNFSTNGGRIEFSASADVDVQIKFRLENAPHPDIDPNRDFGTVTVIGGPTATTYSVSMGADSHPYKSFIMYILTRDVAVTMTDFVIYSDDVLSVSKINDFELSLYPNPVKDIARISSAESIDLVRVFDLTGRIIKEANPNKQNFDLDVANLSKGVYLVKLNAGDKEATTKLIK